MHAIVQGGCPAVASCTAVHAAAPPFHSASAPILPDVADRRRIVDRAGTGTASVDLGAHETQR